jgi:hypothetical protein
VKLLLFTVLALAAPDQPYVNTTSVQADQKMQRIASKDPSKLPEPEKIEWVRARLAWIALRRLEGREAEAVRLFEGCGRYCGKYGPEKEWEKVRDWGCRKNKKALPCQK